MANTFKSERLIYRAVEEDDDKFLATLGQETESYLNASSFLMVPPGKANATSARTWLSSCLIGVIICLPDKTPVGYIALTGSNPKMAHHRNSMIGLTLSESHQGQGYGSEAILWILKWAFTSANLHHIEIGAAEWNPRAIALYERLGFKLEGRSRENWFGFGRYWDVISLGMLESEWRSRYGKENS